MREILIEIILYGMALYMTTVVGMIICQRIWEMREAELELKERKREEENKRNGL